MSSSATANDSQPLKKFADMPQFGFITQTVDVRTSDGLDDVLMSPIVYLAKDGRTLRAPIGGTTDGLSVPRCVQNIIPATGGDWFSGVLHDSAYRRQIELISDGEWHKAFFTQQMADNLILEAMESQGVGWFMRYLIFFALRLFGFKAWADDAAKVK